MRDIREVPDAQDGVFRGLRASGDRQCDYESQQGDPFHKSFGAISAIAYIREEEGAHPDLDSNVDEEPDVAFANALASGETGGQDWRLKIKTWSHHRFVLPGVFAFVFSLSWSADAQGPAPTPLFSPAPVSSARTAPEPSGVHDLTKADLEAFLDALLPAQLQSRDIAGAVVAVVKDGQILLAKGYGYADFAAKKPVVADQTLFRPGSISKVFTATAVMQLVGQGKLDLDRDVNDYLDFAIPKAFPEPITLRRLLTHTAGFEETLKICLCRASARCGHCAII